MRDCLRDTRLALRMLRRHPSFTMTAVVTLALAIGANVLAFAALNAIVWRPLPFDRSDQLVQLIENVPGEESGTGAPQRTGSMAPEVFRAWRAATRTLADVGLMLPATVSVVRGSGIRRVEGWRVSAATLSMLRTPPIVGRALTAADEPVGAPRVVVISHRIWLSEFAADPHVLGQTLRIDGVERSVVGVMPPDFSPFDRPADVWIPSAFDGDGGQLLRVGVLARIKDGVSLGAAQTEADLLCQQLLDAPTMTTSASGAPVHRIEVRRWQDELVAPIRPYVPALIGALAFVLLIACVNITNLFLARAVRHRREIAIRSMLGATRGDLVQHVLTEIVTVAVVAGACGVVLAAVGVQVLVTLTRGLARPDLGGTDVLIPRVAQVSVDAQAVLFALAITAVTGLLCALGAIVRIDRQSMTRAAGRTAVDGWRDQFSLPRVFIAAQVSLTLALLCAALLLIQSFVRMAGVDHGYDASSVVTFQLDADDGTELLPRQARQFARADALLARLRSIPGISAAAYTTAIPFVEGRYLLLLARSPGAPPVPVPHGESLLVSPDFMRAFGMRVVAGRGFAAADAVRSEATFVINRTLARTAFGGSNPVGQRVALWSTRLTGTIVGVVDDVREHGVGQPPNPLLYMTRFHTTEFLPVLNDGLYFTVRVNGDVSAMIESVRNATREVAPTAAMYRVATVDEIVSDSLRRPRAYAALFTSFAGLACTLVAAGLFGVISFLVRQRRHELGIRAAVGARPRDIVALVTRDTLLTVAAGTTIGLGLALAFAASLRGLLFGVGPFDATSYAGATLMLAVIAAVAGYLPAQRAGRIDPATVLRVE